MGKRGYAAFLTPIGTYFVQYEEDGENGPLPIEPVGEFLTWEEACKAIAKHADVPPTWTETLPAPFKGNGLWVYEDDLEPPQSFADALFNFAKGLMEAFRP